MRNKAKTVLAVDSALSQACQRLIPQMKKAGHSWKNHEKRASSLIAKMNHTIYVFAVGMQEANFKLHLSWILELSWGASHTEQAEQTKWGIERWWRRSQKWRDATWGPHCSNQDQTGQPRMNERYSCWDISNSNVIYRIILLSLNWNIKTGLNLHK